MSFDYKHYYWISTFFNVLLLGALIVALAVGCDEAWAEVYDVEQIADAIYIIEGGTNAKKPYGILSVPCHSEAECRRIALTSIENQFTRWQIAGSKGDFLLSLQQRYAPTKNATNDPQGLNSNWLSNLRYHLNKND